ncbi:MATH domain-containing protein [Prochlorococcus marinus]|uniref:MATH domain-containing protein n=1 Tax=Prochlorococcus marinus TaxID=1219 RepID=UPI0022B481A7|nr:MATH domain-containing protein [Prochlorococcus marinus]
MNNNHSPQNAISHKELNDFFIKAKKDISSSNTSENNQIKVNQEFSDLIKTWTETSQKILLMMNKEQKIITENRNPKSLIGFGAMGAHINMALQALKAAGSDQ